MEGEDNIMKPAFEISQFLRFWRVELLMSNIHFIIALHGVFQTKVFAGLATASDQEIYVAVAILCWNPLQ